MVNAIRWIKQFAEKITANWYQVILLGDRGTKVQAGSSDAQPIAPPRHPPSNTSLLNATTVG